jgi:hypothetical protein
MHCENCASLVEFAACADAGVPPDAAGAEPSVELLEELPPQAASATAELATTAATAPARPRRRIARGGDFVYLLLRTLLIFFIGLPP